MGQALVPLFRSMTSFWTAIPSCAALSSRRRLIQRVILGPIPTTGPPPMTKASSLEQSGVLPKVTSTAAQKSGAMA